VPKVPTAAKARRWDRAEVVRVLLAEEAAGRDRANLNTRRKRAGFPAGKTFGDWDETASSIARPTQDALKSLEWVTRRENLCVCGPSGTGKSHFCEALGQAAIEAGMSVAWFTIEDLGALVRRHRVDDSIARALARLIRSDLIIIDDIGLLPVSPDAAEGFYRLWGANTAYMSSELQVSGSVGDLHAAPARTE
jgi:DNA replication protein DnaC